MKTIDILALGELNVDLICNRIDGMPEIGKEKFCQDMTVTLGSSTAIFAANAAALGAKVAFCGMIGNDAFGKLVETSLQQKKVDTHWLIHTNQYATGATIVLSYDEDRANITYQGAMDYMGIDTIDKTLFNEVRHIHISSIFMQSALKRDLMQILKLAQVNGITTSLDTQWDPTETWDLDYQQILPLVTVFMPNETELRFLTGCSTTTEAVETIRPYVNNAVIKQGSHGSLLMRKGYSDLQIPALLNDNVVDCIGAGDSFNAGFITRFVAGDTLEECQRYGNMTGAVSTTAAGGTGAFSSKQDIENIGKQRFGWNA
ncbi:MAG: carbohydrate kinase family protein [Paludibacter sp.]|nr:carbohydrate kinase family protein [Bacteroidales bacterium]MCM1068498.1 carbohydrate kinase family protein [Prevotella sp.]MCM1353452.1 carbohydrate kinase family protein [Bacteroides sp.]MCM1442613.1 carbohydrate kinase family protein [Muribaculum sp.]MCM1481458.1 carbohydrate kinase family protein [Paludibacter sp.]